MRGGALRQGLLAMWTGLGWLGLAGAGLVVTPHYCPSRNPNTPLTLRTLVLCKNFPVWLSCVP